MLKATGNLNLRFGEVVSVCVWSATRTPQQRFVDLAEYTMESYDAIRQCTHVQSSAP